MKRCTECGVEKAPSDFAQRDATGALRSYCRSCGNAHRRANYRKFLDRERDGQASRYHQNPDAAKERTRKWRALNPESSRLASRNNQAKRRAAIRTSEVEKIDYAEVYRLGSGRCGLCGSRVALDDGSIDHITPLSHGGAHTYANIQLAHRSCNSSKGNRVFGAGEQPRLV